MLKKISRASSRREMAQRDSVELWETERASAPCTSSPSPAHPQPRGTHIDTGGIKGALDGDGAGGQQHPALIAQGEPDGHEQPQQAAEGAQAAAGAQGQQRPFLQEGEKRQRGDGGGLSSPGRTPKRGCGGSLGGLQPPACWERGWGCLRRQQGRGNGTAAGQRLHRRWSVKSTGRTARSSACPRGHRCPLPAGIVPGRW